MMAKWAEYATPGEGHARLAKLAGNWDYTMKWWMSPDAQPEESSGTMSAQMTMDGRYLVEGNELTVGEVILMVSQEIEKAGGSALAVDVLVRADRTAPLRHVNALADGLIDMKVRNWRLGTAVPLGPHRGGSP